MPLKGKTIGIFVEDVYEDRELWYPADRLKEERAQVVIIGPKEGETYTSKHGYPAKAEQSAEQAKADKLDGLVIPGGYAPDRMRRHAAMVRLTADMVKKDKVVAAICHAGWMLCSAKVLEGRRVTSFSSIRDDMVHAGAEWVDEEVVRDGNLITSRHPGDLPAFARAIIEAFR